MSRAARLMFYMLLGADGVALPDTNTGECAPYTRQPYNALSIDLANALIRFPSDAVSVDLCEDMT